MTDRRGRSSKPNRTASKGQGFGRIFGGNSRRHVYVGLSECGAWELNPYQRPSSMKPQERGKCGD